MTRPIGSRRRASDRVPGQHPELLRAHEGAGRRHARGPDRPWRQPGARMVNRQRGRPLRCAVQRLSAQGPAGAEDRRGRGAHYGHCPLHGRQAARGGVPDSGPAIRRLKLKTLSSVGLQVERVPRDPLSMEAARPRFSLSFRRRPSPLSEASLLISSGLDQIVIEPSGAEAPGVATAALCRRERTDPGLEPAVRPRQSRGELVGKT